MKGGASALCRVHFMTASGEPSYGHVGRIRLAHFVRPRSSWDSGQYNTCASLRP